MNLLKICFVLLFTSLARPVEEPIKKTWKDLTDVEFERKFIVAEQNYFYIPTFGKSVLALNGKTVQITGYFIPFNDEFQVLSAYPMASCFFCGAAGAESMAEVHFAKKGQRYKTDQRLTIKGTFKTNPADLDHLNYILEDAEVVK
jgi:hypothetical protein